MYNKEEMELILIFSEEEAAATVTTQIMVHAMITVAMTEETGDVVDMTGDMISAPTAMRV